MAAVRLLFFAVSGIWLCGAGTITGAPATTTVEVVSTNTRSGQIDMGKVLASMPDAVDKTDAPDSIYHGAVAVFGSVYDFIAEDGVVKTDTDRYFIENVPLWIDGLFQTTRTEPEFAAWLKKQTKSKYTKTSYDLVDNNCLHFVADAVRFLGGKEPKKLKNQRIFAQNNRDNVELLKGLAKAANVTAENLGLGSVRRSPRVH